MNLKRMAKTAALHSGAFSLLHRLRNRESLTVLMFHRVLPAEPAKRLCADPEYTVTPDLLGEVVQFCKRHHSPVGLEDVLASRERIRPLPPYPVLVTFDDGWRDNLDHALPVLEQAGVPWVLFAATEAVSEPAAWWQETLLWALRSGRASYEELWAAASGDAGVRSEPRNPPHSLSLLMRYGALPEEKRKAALDPYTTTLREALDGNMALSAADLRAMRQKGVGIGAHGYSHLPLSLVDRAEKDIVAARDWLTANVDVTTENTISFPHGRYDSRAVRAARDAGYRLLFTSDPVLNPCPGGWLSSDIVGRIPIATGDVAGANGTVKGERLAPWLFLRERTVLSI
ncbi:MAG TPA: polysaccharide deacetylase family protein [Xanthobacteraceae bacterium]|jgi:peptidoglycan/xylan/chitin deacetylase (PgdA/CDA1 family)|nr:polysaccharide deacetylase family protein [Xanthobacteraceae bacterium]